MHEYYHRVSAIVTSTLNGVSGMYTELTTTGMLFFLAQRDIPITSASGLVSH